MMAETAPVLPPWYKTEIGPHLGVQMRHLLENYSGLHPDDVEPHAYRIVYLSHILFLPTLLSGYRGSPATISIRSFQLT